MIVSLVSLAKKKQMYTNMLYLVLSLPLGIISLVAVIVCAVMSLLTPIVLIVTPLTILCFMGLWQLATFERWLARTWLHIDIPPMFTPAQPGRKWLQRIQDRLVNPVTWKSLLYLFVKFPFSLFSFNIVVSFACLMLALGVVSFVLGCLALPFVLLARISTRAKWRKGMIKSYLLGAATGFGLIALPFYVFSGLIWLWGRFARAMLGMSDKDMRLMEARALAEQERARAEQADQKRRELIINVSHELRTPVASIRGHIESLQAACATDGSSGPSPATLHKYLNIVHRESVRLGTLVEDLLSLARTEANDLRVNMAAVAVSDVVEEVYQTLMPLARRERQIVLVRDVASGLPNGLADRQRLIQVLLNLVRNAITYTPDGGIVSIKLQRASDAHYLELIVADTGIGISPEDQQRIFERFYRTDASRTRGSGGFGLGLAIVRDFVMAMGGTISVTSKVGEGSSFCVQLQVAEQMHQQIPMQYTDQSSAALQQIIKQ